MASKRLMCVWAAAATKCTEDGLCAGRIANILDDDEMFNRRHFMTQFQNDVDFADFETYAFNNLRSKGQYMKEAVERIEKHCWKIYAKNSSLDTKLSSETQFILWQVFNVVCESGSFPPFSTKSTFVFDQLQAVCDVDTGGKVYNKQTFEEFLEEFDSLLGNNEAAHFAAEYLNNFLVLEIIQSGCSNKRTHRNKKWTGWQKRHFVLAADRLLYYQNEGGSLKGQVLIDAKVRVEKAPKYKSFMKSFNYCLDIHYEEKTLQMGLSSSEDCRQWLTALQEVQECAKQRTTPIQKVLAECAGQAAPQNEMATVNELGLNNVVHIKSDELLKSRSKFAHRATTVKRSQPSAKIVYNQILDFPDDIEDDGDYVPFYGQSNSHNPDDNEESEEQFDNNPEMYQQERIKAVFLKIDTDGNGFIDRSEFFNFINNLDKTLSRGEVNQLFDVIKDNDVDGNLDALCFEAFRKYFMNMIVNESDKRCEIQNKFASIFTVQDKTGELDFKAFVNFARKRRRSINVSMLRKAFKQMDLDNSGTINGQEFAQFISHSSDLAPILEEDEQLSENNNDGLKDKLFEAYDQAEVEEIATLLRKRWERFASFKRYGASGELAMQGESGMVADVIPGVYNLVDLACFDDLPPLEPNYIQVKVDWQQSTRPGRSGKLVFPADFDGIIPVEMATSATLRYYGCSFAEESTVKVSLLYRSGIQDFSYRNNYLNDFVTDKAALGGSGVERHEFSHLDCPLFDDNGHFVLGKMVGDNLQLTAFKVPRRHTLYIPGGTIHTNDYLRGTWRTMLSDEHVIDHVHLVRSRSGSLENFTFSFDT